MQAQHAIPSWSDPLNFGDSAQDDQLESLMQSIRWSATPAPVVVTLEGLVSQANYRLQLLFHEVRLACLPVWSSLLRQLVIFARPERVVCDHFHTDSSCTTSCRHLTSLIAPVLAHEMYPASAWPAPPLLVT